MKRQFAIATFIVGLLGGCSSDVDPQGQVVATVDGVEITQTELNAELGGMVGANADEQKALEAGVLQNIVNRVLLAKAASMQELDKTPDGAFAKLRAEQAALISLLEKSLLKQTPTASKEGAAQFVAENPVLFDQRRIFLVEQVVVPNRSPKLVKDLKPLETMAEVQSYLSTNSLPNQLTYGVIDALQVDPAITRQIIALAPNAVFILPQGDSLRINRIRETQIVPITGTDAVSVAEELLNNARRQQQLNSAVSSILEAGRTKVRYNPAFKPPPRVAAKAGVATEPK